MPAIKEKAPAEKSRQKLAAERMTSVQRIHRALRSGPPGGEMKTPLAALTAARALHKEIETRLGLENVQPEEGECGVAVAYITPDLTLLGVTPFFVHGKEAAIMAGLDGNVPLGLIFVLADGETVPPSRVVGSRAFFTTKQTNEWLEAAAAELML